ncbi:MAG: diaminopimelate decarboxylase [Ruminococcaceae bacterium]|nr:diaminopimelate decarboxylase [Oscillospiraceae bacterium]
MLYNNLTIGENGHLFFAGLDTVALGKKYGTPLYLIDEEKIRENCRLYKSFMDKYFDGKARVLFASKSLSYKNIYEIVSSEGLYIDVVSGGELYTAYKAGFDTSKMYFHGNNKTDADIEDAIEKGIGYFVADNREELDSINRIAGEKKIKQQVLLRITPGIDPHTHKAVVTGSVDSKFGSAIETGQAMEIVKYTLALPNVELKGLHCHVGSQIFDSQPFVDASKIMCAFIKDILEETGYKTEFLNLGGGLGVRYTEADPVLDYDAVFSDIANTVKEAFADGKMEAPVLCFEPGRSIVANAGITLYTVGSFKSITGYKNYVSIDGGMPDNPRYALYQSKYTALIADRAGEEASLCVTVAGRCCESGDLIGEDMMLQRCSRGDTLAVLVTGAYNYSMASNYNRLPRPAIVNVYKGETKVVVKRESYEDLIRNDL